MARELLHLDDVFPVKEADLELPIPVDPEAVYYLRPITVEKAREFQTSHTRYVPNRRTHQRDAIVDTEAVQNAFLDYCIVRWEGVRNGSDPAPCDLAHKLMLPGVVQVALVDQASIGGNAASARVESFREPADVRPVLDGPAADAGVLPVRG